MGREVFQGLVRHVLTIVGGALAARYGIEGELIDGLVGGAAAAAGIVWSVVAKRGAAATARERA